MEEKDLKQIKETVDQSVKQGIREEFDQKFSESFHKEFEQIWDKNIAPAFEDVHNKIDELDKKVNNLLTKSYLDD